ncbi:envelope stress response membrane protein PspC [Nitrospirillum amazonense]|uniref:Phage shock protein C (PspC) family protein n=1 Tax=Nitrospirillum amazonense TaxID=28077 RepID=A0A560JVN0_9PROT|nr:envelope stress response membrane protein PspC [Nitrospirillum amazonense]MDG3440488.1 envelope stress response membrane protein PspC [Nitrospirillum amazonense]MEC4593193.1 envelope stress response membrane protein PspC [Nitrospirillum amazonense]TWB18940.1 phage shock protein C (PspC) family protein [Nitrospirillum amazonense]TWB75175.1 phage shock protein C (PspC) family protein [Nitrospirillum amazonense]
MTGRGSNPPPFPGRRPPGGTSGGGSGGYGGGSRWTNPAAGAQGGTYGGGGTFGSPNPHRLYRNPRAGKVAGVCAGVADYFSVDAWLVRLGMVLGLVFFFPATIIAYIVLAVVLKPQPQGLYGSNEEEVFWRSVTTRPDQTLAGLRAKFRDLDREIGAMETAVASREFDLRRQFKDLEK